MPTHKSAAQSAFGQHNDTHANSGSRRLLVLTASVLSGFSGTLERFPAYSGLTFRYSGESRGTGRKVIPAQGNPPILRE
jgi:hypothetical protein